MLAWPPLAGACLLTCTTPLPRPQVLNGVLQARATAGGQVAEQLEQLRLGHIPAGSTDAVSCTLHGTRSAFTAAVHIALGDRCGGGRARTQGRPQA